MWTFLELEDESVSVVVPGPARVPATPCLLPASPIVVVRFLGRGMVFAPCSDDGADEEDLLPRDGACLEEAYHGDGEDPDDPL